MLVSAGMGPLDGFGGNFLPSKMYCNTLIQLDVSIPCQAIHRNNALKSDCYTVSIFFPIEKSSVIREKREFDLRIRSCRARIGEVKGLSPKGIRA